MKRSRARIAEFAAMSSLIVVFSSSIVFADQAVQQTEQPAQARDMQEQQADIAGTMDNDALPATRESETLPDKVLVRGVPFISWREAAQIKYVEKDILNPSWAASSGMIWEYWGKGREILEGTGQEATSGFQVISGRESGQAWDIRDLKTSLARGIPVDVSLPLTPEAHPLYMTFEIMITFGQVTGVELKDQGRPRSNALGRMVSLEDLQKVKEQMKTNPIMESVVLASRLVIGYDDERKVFIVHDPSFGPAFEIRFDDFERMWAAADRNYFLVIPDGYPKGMPERPSIPDYRPRTSDEKAATHFAYGYALDCIGRLEEGAKHFETGLEIPEIAKGYQFLLYFELALNRGERSDFAGAVEAAEKATAILPEHPGAWDFLSKAYRIHPEGGDRRKARKAEKKAKALQGDQQAQKIVAATIPANFFIQYLGSIRGWGGEGLKN